MTHEEITQMIGIDIHSEEWRAYNAEIVSIIERYASFGGISNADFQRKNEMDDVQTRYGWTRNQVDIANCYDWCSGLDWDVKDFVKKLPQYLANGICPIDVNSVEWVRFMQEIGHLITEHMIKQPNAAAFHEGRAAAIRRSMWSEEQVNAAMFSVENLRPASRTFDGRI